VQFKVPQNIDMADRIVGPLTLIQFLYLLVGGIIVYALFSTIAPINPTLFLALAGPITLFSLALAFLKIQDQPFPKFVAAFFIYIRRPKARVWFKDGRAANSVVITPNPVVADQSPARKELKRDQLQQLATTLDQTSQAMNTGGSGGAK
jgi:hypothetical protein